MDCRHFRKKHALFIDDTLSGVEMWSMRDHLTVCESCTRLDTQLRRALMVARSARVLEPSPGFRRKLAARLAVERMARPSVMGAPATRRWAGLAVAAGLALTVGLGLVGGLGILQPTPPTPSLVMAPVVVTPPTLPTEPVAAPAMFATVSSSLPVYPAMLLAQRATEQFAATHARTVSFQAAH